MATVWLASAAASNPAVRWGDPVSAHFPRWCFGIVTLIVLVVAAEEGFGSFELVTIAWKEKTVLGLAYIECGLLEPQHTVLIDVGLKEYGVYQRNGFTFERVY